MDKYVSIDPSNEAFFGKGSVVVKDSTGCTSDHGEDSIIRCTDRHPLFTAAVTCANFVNQVKLSTQAAGNKTQSSSTMMSSTMAQTQTAGSQQGSSSTSSGFAARTAIPIAGVLGMAALLI